MRVRLKSKMTQRVAVVATAAAALATAALATAPTASADSRNGCAWPRVCFYLTSSDWADGDPTAAYQDVTTSYQNLGPQSRGANYVTNTRNDDRAYLRLVYDDGSTHYRCLVPNGTISFANDVTVTGIRIDTASSC